MKLWRIYTEDKPNLASLTSSYFAGFTLLEGTGYWQGKAEKCAVIEIIQLEQGNTHARVNALAVDIKLRNAQESVLVTEQDTVAKFV